ncbi:MULTISPECIES: hypothetical protein [Erwinia]|uniref:Uncharacterized protein n=1 Tax=Erwinia rhapontici TaxID=55212 RepID=A0ABN6DLY4_ERWRD|nr:MULTISPECIES: hypothetical protein [Erwinia]MCS3607350.1 hypothetical protein [Erwinia rhapontici]NNS09904.1 hypothetical protein [Erwinia sp. JH02]BCQ35522.1 hypothetical protein ERHA53_28650 [Erwinia rhapontici]BCQ45692.1 hypothetical protein ERHA55_32190 [Erwinia rhapontici]
MGIIAAGLREWNFQKIARLTKAGLSDRTIASAINDDLKERNIEAGPLLTAKDIGSYKKISHLAGERSLITEPKVRALIDDPDPNAPVL